MIIELANYAGFCFGVERAIDLVESTIEQHDNVVTLGPIIHNPQVVERLAQRGVQVNKDLNILREDNTVIIRSHGVPRECYGELEQKRVNVVDATCPFVQKAQKAAQTLSDSGASVVVFGEKDHPEVVSIVSFVQGECFVVSSPEEARELPERPYYGLLAQTTQHGETFNAIARIIQTKCKTFERVNTICNATTHRQSAAVELAKRSDVMIIVGGKNSANTTRLYQICLELCPRSYHIETKDEISDDMLHGAEKIGITAGASTPKSLILEVRDYIQEVSK